MIFSALLNSTVKLDVNMSLLVISEAYEKLVVVILVKDMSMEKEYYQHS